MQSSFSMRNKRLASPENPGIIAGAYVLLYTDVGDQTVSVGSVTFSEIRVKPLQSLRRSMHGHSQLRNDGSDLTVIAKVTIGRGVEKYRYPYRFSGPENPPAALGEMHHIVLYV